MQKILPALISYVLLLATARAQVTVEVLLEQSQFLLGESMPVGVRVVNRSGQTLKLGAEPDWLVFNVEGRGGFVPAKISEPTVVGAFDLSTSKMAIKTVDLAPHFKFTAQESYEITATVRIPGWEDPIVSPPQEVQISRGTKIWEADFGVPPSEGSTGAPEVRKYALIEATRLKQITLYSRVTDASGSWLLKVNPLGPLLSFGRPAGQLDRFCNLHVLWQNGAHTYQYAVINPEGILFARQTIDFADVRPRLVLTEAGPDAGRIRVNGGERRFTATDVPPREPDKSGATPAEPPLK